MELKKFWSTIKPYIYLGKSKQNGRIVLEDNETIIRGKRDWGGLNHRNNFFTSFGSTEQGTWGVKPTPKLSHIQQNLIPKHPLSLKKTNLVEVKRSDVTVESQDEQGNRLWWHST